MKKSKPEKKHTHPDHSSEVPRLRKIVGQLAGIEKMISERRYCPEILQQVRAAHSAVKALEIAILKGHLSLCVKDAAKNGSEATLDKKLSEIFELIKG